MRLVTTVLILIAVPLAVPCSQILDDGDSGIRVSHHGSTSKSAPQPILQLAQPGQPGYINWNKTELQPGDTVYILPTTTPRDQNGYVPLHAFNNAVNGTYLYAESKSFRYEFAPNSRYKATITNHGFKCSTAGALETQRVIPQQRVVFYDLP